MEIEPNSNNIQIPFLGDIQSNINKIYEKVNNNPEISNFLKTLFNELRLCKNSQELFIYLYQKFFETSIKQLPIFPTNQKKVNYREILAIDLFHFDLKN